jgi:hypothetical protein
MDSLLLIAFNTLVGFILGYLLSSIQYNFKINNERLRSIIHILSFPYLSEKRRDYYSNRFLTLAGFSLTSLALYLSWHQGSQAYTSKLIYYLFLSTIIFLISSQVTLEAEKFWQLWLSELFHYFGIFTLLYGIRGFIQEIFPDTNLVFLTSLTIVLVSLYVYKLFSDLIEMINNNQKPINVK